MASDDRATSHTLAEQEKLAQQSYQHDFYKIVRFLECLYGDQSRLGESVRPAEDAVRLVQNPSLAFAPTTVANFSPAKEEKRPQLSVNFLGLFGPNGPLPIHLTEYANDRRRVGDTTFGAFADLFHHRMLSLFYRAWANAQPTVHYDRPAHDRFSHYVGAFIGRGMPSMLGRDALPDTAKLFYAGQMAGQTASAESLRAIIADYFRMPVVIEQFIGQWVELPEECRCRLGVSPDTGTLGLTVAIGMRFWDHQSKFRIIFGPIGLDEYQRMLPGGESLRQLIALVRNYAGDTFSWDVKLKLNRSDASPVQLGKMGKLGWTSWLMGFQSDMDADHMVFCPMTESA